MFSEKRTKYQYFNDFTRVVFNFQYDASYNYYSQFWFNKLAIGIQQLKSNLQQLKINLQQLKTNSVK